MKFDRWEYYRGKSGVKYGVFNTYRNCFQFNIAEDTPFLATDEDEKIRRYYPVKGSRMLYMLPGKNKTDLFARAIRLGVKFKRGD